jgi:transposase
MNLPARFGKSNSVCRRFRRLAQKGVWETLFEALKAPELDWVMLDSTILRAHQHSAGQKKAPLKPNAWAAAGAG